MAITASIILDTRRKTAKGYPIKIRVKNYYISLDEYSSKDHWDANNVTAAHPDYRRLHLKLERRKVQLMDELQYCNDNNLDLKDSIQVIKKGLQDRAVEIFSLQQKIKQLQGSAGFGFLAFFDVRMQEKLKAGESITHYQLTKDRLVNYLGPGNDINMNAITYEWLNTFVLHKLDSGTNRGGINSYLETMRAVYKEAQRRESLNIKKDNPFKGVIKGSKRREIVELSKDDLKKLLSYNPEKAPTKLAAKIQRRHIALWIFQYVIGGHDYIDVARLKWNDIKDNRIRFKRYKNRNKIDGGTLVDNLLLPFSLEVIDRYGTKENTRVFGFIPDPEKHYTQYTDYRSNVNRSLKTVCKNLNIATTIKTKSPRYLFRSKAGELLIHDLIVMQLMGHKAAEITYKYQSKLPAAVVDAAHKSIVEATL